MKRGINTVSDLRERCKVDPATGCWIWQHAVAADGVPRIHAVDHERVEKRTMSGPKAVWNIAHNAAPRPGWLVYRCCGQSLCLNPVHLAQARDKAEIGLHQRRSGSRVGTALESRRANVAKALAASGKVPTPDHIVRAIRQAPKSVRNTELAAVHGLDFRTVSRIRLGQTRVGVGA